MLRLYKKFKPIDWVLLLVLIGLTIFQVYWTMELVDYVAEIIKSIMMLNYHNNPLELGEVGQLLINLKEAAGGWDNITTDFLSASGITNDVATTFLTIAKASTKDIWLNGGKMLLAATCNAGCQILIAVIAARLSSSLSTNIRSELYAKINNFSNAEINKYSTASLITRTTNDIQQVQVANVMSLRMIISAPVTAIWAIIKINASSFELTTATIIAVVILVVFIATLMIVTMPKYKVMQKLTDRLNTVSRENLIGLRVIRAYNAEEYQEEKFDKANVNITNTQLFTGRVMGLMSPVMSLIMNGLSLAIYWIGASLINKGTIDYATVTSFMMLTSQIIMSFMMLMMMFILLPRAQVSAKRINEVLDTQISITNPIEEKPLTQTGTIEFKNVSFSYPDSEEENLKNISFKANKGDVVAIIGATGSGKTTFVNLIPRFYDATEGEVIVDGVNVKDLKDETLHKIISIVPQKGMLFSGTVKDNICFGNPDLDLESAIKAAKIAEADNFINEMTDKYDSKISQGGKNVSGGQKQRLSIARAVATSPEIIIFDDSFSALDLKTDKQVRKNLAENMKDTTKIIVAQRIGTIIDADLIIVLEDGEVAGMGKHNELIKTCNIYQEIALSQLSKEELGL